MDEKCKLLDHKLGCCLGTLIASLTHSIMFVASWNAGDWILKVLPCIPYIFMFLPLMILSLSIDQCPGFNYHPAFSVVELVYIAGIFMLCFDNITPTVVHSVITIVYLTFNSFKFGVLHLSIYEAKFAQSIGVWCMSKVFFEMKKRESSHLLEIIQLWESVKVTLDSLPEGVIILNSNGDVMY